MERSDFKKVSFRLTLDLVKRFDKKIKKIQKSEIESSGFRYTTKNKVLCELTDMYNTGKVKMPWEGK